MSLICNLTTMDKQFLSAIVKSQKKKGVRESTLKAAINAAINKEMENAYKVK